MARILMFSAGMDSFILKRVFNFADEECIYVNMGTDEGAKEEKLIREHFPGTKVISAPALVQWELENKIIPFRNNILTFIGAQYANDIYFAFTAGDSTKDKDFVFKAQMEAMLNYFLIDKQKVSRQIDSSHPFIIQMPFKQMTKTEMVSLYIQKQFPVDELLYWSRSCYADFELPCGECRSCLRRYVALHLNDIDQSNCYMTDPALFLEQALQDAIKKERKQEKEEIERCLMLKLR